MIRTLILSHKRAGRVTTHRRVANCELVIPQSQDEAYAKEHPELPRILHPDTVVGMPAKRQWCYDKFGDQMQLDDDLIAIFRIYRRQGGWKKSVLGPSRAYELIQQLGETARQLGAYLFGFGSHANPMTYDALRPFRLGGYSPSGALGLLAGSKLWFPAETTLPVEDYWICLLNSYYHRYCFYDARFAAGFNETYVRAGGLSEFRAPGADGIEPEVAATVYLRRFFGEAIRSSTYGSSVVTKRGKNPGRRQIHLPFTT